jgi:hypothetical protein
MTYNIKPTIAEEALESWVWTNDTSVPSKGFIIIKNPTNGKKIKTFKRTIDDNFVLLYNQHNTNQIDINKPITYLIINEYFRDTLGVRKNEEIELEISKANIFHKLFLIHWCHPNPTVQFANRAMVISIIIGAIALLLTIYITLNPTTSEFCPH